MNKLPLDSILSGDCVDLLAKLPESSVDLIFADPPYNLQLKQELFRPNLSKVNAVDVGWDKFFDFKEYDAFTYQWLSACRHVLKATGTIWIIGSYHNIFRVGAILQDLDFWILNDVVWIKNNPMPNFHGVRFTNAHETLIWAQKNKGSKYTFNYHAMKSLNDDLQMRSDWYLPLCTGNERQKINGEKAHPTQKPEALLYRVLLASTNPGDIILDPFFGTGTTGAVAKKLGRHYIGIERDLDYIQIAQERISTIVAAPAAVLEISNPRQRKRVPFGILLETGLLQPGQMLYFIRGDPTAIIQADGSLRCGTMTGSIHSLAKILSGDIPANGWDCWLFEDVSGQQFPLDLLRKKFQNETAVDLLVRNKSLRKSEAR
ncbi:MAG TPA: DNA methyltransferase [Anaerolineales bacterium]